MRVLSTTEHAGSVKRALGEAVTELNRRLAETPGRIARMSASVDSGVTGATVRIVVAVDESEAHPKCVIWANEAAGNDGTALRRAEEKLNAQLSKLKGQAAGFYVKFIRPPLPKRVYATVIVAVNEEVQEAVKKPPAGERRERLAAAIKLLGGDPRAINLSRMARVFGVSRDVVYRDLEKVGAKRQPKR